MKKQRRVQAAVLNRIDVGHCGETGDIIERTHALMAHAPGTVKSRSVSVPASYTELIAFLAESQGLSPRRFLSDIVGCELYRALQIVRKQFRERRPL